MGPAPPGGPLVDIGEPMMRHGNTVRPISGRQDPNWGLHGRFLLATFKRSGSAPRISTHGCLRHAHDRSWDRANRCSDMNNGSDGDPEMLDLCADSCRPASFTQQQPEAVRAGPHRL